MKFQLAAGFNYAYEDSRGALPLEAAVGLVELGLSEALSLVEQSVCASRLLSLHLSKTPITEARIARDGYIKHVDSLRSKLARQVRANIISIGVHLTGSRYKAAGLLGTADEYRYSSESYSSAISFVNTLAARTGLPVWIENANLYSTSLEQCLLAWQSWSRLAVETGSPVIVDLAHLVIEATNVDISPLTLLGCVPWERVVELHLSGLRRGGDGRLHDGHSLPVSEFVWGILPDVLQLASGSSQKVVWLNIEHTPPAWRDRAEQHKADFDRLSSMIASFQKRTERGHDVPRYMRGYLQYVIRGQIPLLESALDQRGLRLEAVLEDWLSTIQKDKRRIIFSEDEVDAEELANSTVLTRDFLSFAKEKLREVDHGRAY